MLTSSMGRAYLAVIGEQEREALLAELQTSDAGGGAHARFEAAESGTQVQAAARREIAAFDREGCCYSFRDWHDDVNAVAVPFRDPRDGRWLVLSCSGPASSMGEDVFRERIGPRLRALARRLGQAR
jgi:DNA-binding IclR family transcriptional regulator